MRLFALATLAIFLIAATEEGKKPVPISKIPRLIKSTTTPDKRISIAKEYKDVPVKITGKEHAVIETNKGKIEVIFYPDSAPVTVRYFLKLAQLGFYDGLTFHRYVKNFVIQGGDPLGTGAGGTGRNLPLEAKAKHVEGALGIARAMDPNSGSCQFYITLSPQPGLDGKYTVFGRVIKGMDVVKRLRKGDKIRKITVFVPKEK
jgi:cyclophilin family peptidyl-prolyl cis-trans isomerase